MRNTDQIKLENLIVYQSQNSYVFLFSAFIILSDDECRGNLRICKFVCSFQNRKLHRKHDDFMKPKHEPKMQISYIQRKVYGK